jgi:hypothetical protein
LVHGFWFFVMTAEPCFKAIFIDPSLYLLFDGLKSLLSKLKPQPLNNPPLANRKN